MMEKDIKDEFDLDKYVDFELIDDGRYGDTAALKYKEMFRLKNSSARQVRIMFSTR